MDKDGGVGPYVQSERQAQGIYLEYAKKLIDKGEAYYCFCDEERLATLHTTVNGKEIFHYDKHCLHLSKEEVEAKLTYGTPIFALTYSAPSLFNRPISLQLLFRWRTIPSLLEFLTTL